MAIPINRYVRITSGIGAGNNVRARDLILRIFTDNALMSPGEILEFSDADTVAEYFGRTSEEYKRAVQYFGYISPLIVRPSKLSFACDQNTPKPPAVRGLIGDYAVSDFIDYDGHIKFSVDGSDWAVGPLSFANAVSLSDIATTVQTALRTASDNVADATLKQALSTATFTYLPTDSRFVYTAGAPVDAVIKFNATTEDPLADMLGMAEGSVIEGLGEPLLPTESIAEADDISNNYGSFLFLRALDLEQISDIAEYNAAKNIQFMYLVPCVADAAELYSTTLLSIGSVAITLVNTPNTEYDEQIPGILMAATDYTRRNSTLNYMYKQVSGVTPKVTSTTDADKYDKLRINYYGRTQTAGQKIDFYQRGVLMGGATSPVDMNVHANEQWLKDQCTILLMSLQLSYGRLPANNAGIGIILSTLQTAIDTALYNGVISVGKTLETLQKNYITQITGDDLAWQQVQTIGYWVDATIETFVTEDGRTEYQCVYTLVYSKDDAIRRIEGTHILI